MFLTYFFRWASFGVGLALDCDVLRFQYCYWYVLSYPISTQPRLCIVVWFVATGYHFFYVHALSGALPRPAFSVFLPRCRAMSPFGHCPLSSQVLLNIVNFSKRKSLYREGLAPVVCSRRRPQWNVRPRTFYAFAFLFLH